MIHPNGSYVAHQQHQSMANLRTFLGGDSAAVLQLSTSFGLNGCKS